MLNPFRGDDMVGLENKTDGLGRRFKQSSLLLGLCLSLVGATFFAGRAEARPTGPSPEDRQIAKFVRLLMEQRHLTRRTIDDQIAERGLDAFLEMLDPWKLYFYQSDIDEFMASRQRDRQPFPPW